MEERRTYDVSVIVPIYNTEAYLSESLDSLEGQTLERLQVILVDDGSQDRSGEIAEAYAARRPDRFSVIHQENAGQSAARNAGMRLARGTYVGFFDSDDIAFPEMFETLYSAAATCEADHVSCGYQGFVIDADGKRKERPALICGESKTGLDLYHGVKAGAPQHLWRREMLEGHDLAFPFYRAYEDLSFYLSVIPYVGSSTNIARPLFWRRWREGSIMTRYSLEQASCRIQVMRDAFAEYEAKGFSQAHVALLEGVCVRILMMSHLASCGQLALSDRKQALRDIKEFLRCELPIRRRDLALEGSTGLYLRFCPITLLPVVAGVASRAWKNGV